MNIGFYGHSICARINTPNNESYIDQIKNYYSANIVALGSPKASEERILFNLKKTKHDLDYAIVFHSLPHFAFLPKCYRDINITAVPELRANHYWAENLKNEQVDKDTFDNHFFAQGNIKEVFETSENFVNASKMYKEYFYHPDLIMNRFQSTVLMIDNYLYNKGICSYHCVQNKLMASALKHMKFQSGEIDVDILDFEFFPFYNNITQEQNNYIFQKLVNWIDNSKNHPR